MLMSSCYAYSCHTTPSPPTNTYNIMNSSEEKESIVYRRLCIMSWRHFKRNAESYSVSLKWRWKILPAGRTLNGITSFPFPGKRQELIDSNTWFSPTDMDMKRNKKTRGLVTRKLGKKHVGRSHKMGPCMKIFGLHIHAPHISWQPNIHSFLWAILQFCTGTYGPSCDFVPQGWSRLHPSRWIS